MSDPIQRRPKHTLSESDDEDSNMEKIVKIEGESDIEEDSLQEGLVQRLRHRFESRDVDSVTERESESEERAQGGMVQELRHRFESENPNPSELPSGAPETDVEMVSEAEQCVISPLRSDSDQSVTSAEQKTSSSSASQSQSISLMSISDTTFSSESRSHSGSHGIVIRVFPPEEENMDLVQGENVSCSRSAETKPEKMQTLQVPGHVGPSTREYRSAPQERGHDKSSTSGYRPVPQERGRGQPSTSGHGSAPQERGRGQPLTSGYEPAPQERGRGQPLTSAYEPASQESGRGQPSTSGYGPAPQERGRGQLPTGGHRPAPQIYDLDREELVPSEDNSNLRPTSESAQHESPSVDFWRLRAGVSVGDTEEWPKTGLPNGANYDDEEFRQRIRPMETPSSSSSSEANVPVHYPFEEDNPQVQYPFVQENPPVHNPIEGENQPSVERGNQPVHYPIEVENQPEHHRIEIENPAERFPVEGENQPVHFPIEGENLPLVQNLSRRSSTYSEISELSIDLSITPGSTPPSSTPPCSTPRSFTPPDPAPLRSTPSGSTPPSSTPPCSTPPSSTPPRSTSPSSTPRSSTPPDSTPLSSTPPDPALLSSTQPESTPGSATPSVSALPSYIPSCSSPPSTSRTANIRGRYLTVREQVLLRNLRERFKKAGSWEARSSNLNADKVFRATKSAETLKTFEFDEVKKKYRSKSAELLRFPPEEFVDDNNKENKRRKSI